MLNVIDRCFTYPIHMSKCITNRINNLYGFSVTWVYDVNLIIMGNTIDIQFHRLTTDHYAVMIDVRR